MAAGCRPEAREHLVWTVWWYRKVSVRSPIFRTQSPCTYIYVQESQRFGNFVRIYTYESRKGLIADVSVILCQIFVRLYFITVTQLGLNHKNDKAFARWKRLSFAQHDTSHAINTASVVSVRDRFPEFCRRPRSTRPSLIRWLAQRERAFPKFAVAVDASPR